MIEHDQSSAASNRPTPETGVCCPVCGGTRSAVVNSRKSEFAGVGSVRRRRHCGLCRSRFTTMEIPTDFMPEAMGVSEDEMVDALRAAVRNVLNLSSRQFAACSETVSPDERQAAADAQGVD